MKKFYKKFTSKEMMLDKVGSLVEDFDLEKMKEMSLKSKFRLYIVMKDGKVIPCNNFKKFIMLVNSIGKLSLIPKICFGKSQIYHVFSKEDYFLTKVESNVQNTEVVSGRILFPYSEDDAVVNVKEDVGKEKIFIDREHINSLYKEDDKRGSKDRLEDYAKNKYKIDLNKRLKFEAMVDELKSLLEE